MKVVIINNDFRVYWKGRLLYLQKFLSSQKISFYAIELFGNGSPYSFDVYNNKENWWTCLFPHKRSEELGGKDIKKTLFSALDKIMPDIIITSSIVFYAGALGTRWAKKNKKKVIMFDDAIPAQVKRNVLVQRIKNMVTEQVDGLWFPSPHYYTEYPFFHHQGIHFFYGFNCIDNNFFKGTRQMQLYPKTLVCVARLVPVKNVDNLLRAWQHVEQKVTGYKLIIIGDGPELDTLNKLKSALNLNTVEFFGAIDNSVMPQYYHNATAFILPSLSESWGLVVNEAMAAGLPVLLSNRINAAKALLEEGLNGFTFDPLSVNSITGAILKYVESGTEEKNSMSENSLRLINTMTYEKMGSQLLEGLRVINNQKYKSPGFFPGLLINLWKGRYNKTGWFTSSHQISTAG